jgi:hypothetical protein
MKRSAIIGAAALLVTLAACQPDPQVTATPTQTPRPGATESSSVETEATEPAEETLQPTPTLFGQVGPEGFPPDVNPLTGQVVDDPAALDRPPLLVKISNAPGVVRPQSGLMSADHIWEHMMEGFHVATRYTGVFLGETPDRVGSVRSGRLPDLELVPMYGGIYVASGYSTNAHAPGTPLRMRELMLAADWVDRNFSYEFGYRDPYSVRIPMDGVSVEHTLFSIPAELWELAEERYIPASTTLEPGLVFDTSAPEGGEPTEEAGVNYPGHAPDNLWRYDADSGKWLHWVNGAAHSDALTGEQVTFENVVILYAEHFVSDFIEDEGANLYALGFVLTGSGRAVLLRDGQRYEATWERDSADHMIQFFGPDGNLIPFKPGRTWFNVVSSELEPPEILFSP